MFAVEYYDVKSEKVKNGFRIVMLADLHNHEYGPGNQLLLDEIQKINPDFICIAGDMLIGHSQISHSVAQRMILDLAENYQVFYGLGNHEARMKSGTAAYGSKYDDYMNPIRESGVIVLENEHVEWNVGETKIRISGYELPMKYYEKFNRYSFVSGQISHVLGTADDSCYEILLAHNPVYFQQYAQWGADLTLSGHLHGGIIRLPFVGGIITPQVRLLPRYCAGKYERNNRYLIVSRGLGTHSIPIRFNNKPELSVIDVTGDQIGEK